MYLTNSFAVRFSRCALPLWMLLALPGVGLSQQSTVLPAGVEPVWDVQKATRETTFSRERVCINGLWRWQPDLTDHDVVPRRDWGYFKVPGCWPGITNYMQKDCQSVFAHPAWEAERLSNVTAAWYERTVIVPQDWQRRRIVLRADGVNSLAVVYVDGKAAGELRYPGGELDLSTVCQPGATHRIALHVFALPLKAVMLSFSDTAAAKEIQGRVARRGLCGDVYLESSPIGDRIGDVRLATSVRDWQLRQIGRAHV